MPSHLAEVSKPGDENISTVAVHIMPEHFSRTGKNWSTVGRNNGAQKAPAATDADIEEESSMENNVNNRSVRLLE